MGVWVGDVQKRSCSCSKNVKNRARVCVGRGKGMGQAQANGSKGSRLFVGACLLPAEDEAAGAEEREREPSPKGSMAEDAGAAALAEDVKGLPLSVTG